MPLCLMVMKSGMDEMKEANNYGSLHNRTTRIFLIDFPFERSFLFARLQGLCMFEVKVTVNVVKALSPIVDAE